MSKPMANVSQELQAAMWGLFARSVGDFCRAAQSQSNGIHSEVLQTAGGKQRVLIACVTGGRAVAGPATELLCAPPAVLPNWPHANMGRLVMETITGNGFGYYTSPAECQDAILLIAAEPRSFTLLEFALKAGIRPSAVSN